MDNKKVLVVDDDPLIVEILKKGLEMAGFLVSTATSYAQVKDVLSKIIPDAILMDIIFRVLTASACAEKYASRPRRAKSR